MGEQKTMTLNLRADEMAVVDQLAAEHGLKTAVIRQVLRWYQLTNHRLREGETVSFSGDQGRVVLFAGIGFHDPARAALQQQGEER